ncbi:LCP family glycopolymer transferase [Lacticaseibacillus daqingensis]|uniref:LCP family glycopolymer transferase n=1 Tax=Lacticaseibacillus daqingensis TaxID=2486014 RepID=UPI000F767733|nr:LCP family protein [Lacticaseibacillus daqingensis]
MDSRSARHKMHHPILKLILLVVSTALVAGGLYGLRLYSQAKYAIDSTYSKLGSDSNTDVATTIKTKKPFAALLLGVDTGADGRTEKGRTDTMIIAVVNPAKQSTTLVSIPRDTAAKMIGTKSFNMQKINAAYELGGSTMAVDTAKALVNVPIKYYLTVNMAALQKIVDAVGGIDVAVPFTFTSKYTGGQTFTKGQMHLNGELALAYARMRHEDPQGDYGRQQRQQQVIKAIMKKAVSMDALKNFSTLLKTISGNMRTNLSFDDMMSLVQNYRGAAKTITTDHIQGHDAWVYPGPASYQIPATEELQRVSDKLRAALGLSKETLANQNVRENNANTQFNWDNANAQTYTIYNPDL